MKNLIIVHKQPYSALASRISETLSFLDKTYNNPVIALDNSNNIDESWDKMSEAYLIDDFDFYIITVHGTEDLIKDKIDEMSNQWMDDTYCISGDCLISDDKLYEDFLDTLAHCKDVES